jgi:hypothetical protein
MAEQAWTPSKVTLGHLQSLANQGFIMVAELTAYRVPEDPSFPAPVKGYMVTFVEFYERGFGVPSHQFICSFLQHYSLKLTI